MRTEAHTINDIVTEAGSLSKVIGTLFALSKRHALSGSYATHIIISEYIHTCLKLQLNNASAQEMANHYIEDELFRIFVPKAENIIDEEAHSDAIEYTLPFESIESILDEAYCVITQALGQPIQKNQYSSHRVTFNETWPLYLFDLMGNFSFIQLALAEALASLPVSQFGKVTLGSQISEIGVIRRPQENQYSLYISLQDDSIDRSSLHFLRERTIHFSYAPKKASPYFYEVVSDDRIMRMPVKNQYGFYTALDCLKKLFVIAIRDPQKNWNFSGSSFPNS